MRLIKRLLYFTLTISLVILFSQCESNDKIYRPNLPEKLCSIGIIDANNLIRHISFEKSFQIEYPNEVNDSLREFSFSIFSSQEELFSYKSDSTIKNIQDIRIPDSIKFNSGEKYFLKATEKSMPEISSEITVPEPPAGLKYISIENEVIASSRTQECGGFDTFKSIVLGISFINKNIRKQFYSLLLQGSGIVRGPGSGFGRETFLDFSIRETNSPGFFAVMHGLTMFHFSCFGDWRFSYDKSPVSAYFIDGSKIPDDTCYIMLSTQFQDGYSIYDALRSLKVTLLAIPEELYIFEKSLNVYGRVSKDPFSEPINLDGNIAGGNGIFAICKSSEITINFAEGY